MWPVASQQDYSEGFSCVCCQKRTSALWMVELPGAPRVSVAGDRPGRAAPVGAGGVGPDFIFPESSWLLFMHAFTH